MAQAVFNWEQEERENRRKGIIVSVIIHALLLLLFLLLGLTRQIPPPGEQGISVIFGTTDVGSGNEAPTSTDPEPMTTPPVTEDVVEETETEATPEAVEAPSEPVTEPVSETVTQDFEEAPVVNNKPPVETAPETENTKPEPVKPATEPAVEEAPKPKPKPEPQVNNDALFPGTKSDNNNPGSKGNDNQPGDKGDLTGTPDGKNWSGQNTGKGDEGDGPGDWGLSGRGLIGKVPPDYPSEKTGTVRINIVVDQSGKVIRAEYSATGSTTQDPALVKAAKDAAMKYKFTDSPTASPEQHGYIIFNFRLK